MENKLLIGACINGVNCLKRSSKIPYNIYEVNFQDGGKK